MLALDATGEVRVAEVSIFSVDHSSGSRAPKAPLSAKRRSTRKLIDRPNRLPGFKGGSSNLEVTIPFLDNKVRTEVHGAHPTIDTNPRNTIPIR